MKSENCTPLMFGFMYQNKCLDDIFIHFPYFIVLVRYLGRCKKGD